MKSEIKTRVKHDSLEIVSKNILETNRLLKIQLDLLIEQNVLLFKLLEATGKLPSADSIADSVVSGIVSY